MLMSDTVTRIESTLLILDRSWIENYSLNQESLINKTCHFDLV